MFANGLLERGSIHYQAESYWRLKKWYLISPCLTLRIIRLSWKIQGKASRPPLHLGVVDFGNGTFGFPLTTITNFTYIYIYIYIYIYRTRLRCREHFSPNMFVRSKVELVCLKPHLFIIWQQTIAVCFFFFSSFYVASFFQMPECLVWCLNQHNIANIQHLNDSNFSRWNVTSFVSFVILSWNSC